MKMIEDDEYQRKDDDLAIIEQHVDQLCEHFDTVHIFVTRHSPMVDGGTVNANQGSGNWFARYGQVKQWVVKEERFRENLRKEENEDD